MSHNPGSFLHYLIDHRRLMAQKGQTPFEQDVPARWLLLAAIVLALATACGATPGDAPADVTPPTPDPGLHTATVAPAFELDGQGENVDSIAIWEAQEPRNSLMFVTSKGNQLVEVWRYPFVQNEMEPLRHESFGSDTAVNGVVVDQAQDLIYVVVSAPASTVSIFALPDLTFRGQFIEGAVDLGPEPNIALLPGSRDPARLYVSSENEVYVHNANDGELITQFTPSKELETMVADAFYQTIYIPDENDHSGIYAYDPDGNPLQRSGDNNFGDDGVFQSDAEGIVIYRCHVQEGIDDGHGFIVVADQRDNQTDFEFFDRETWAHLGTATLQGVSNTDGVASTQIALPDYPLGLLVAVDDDATTVGVGWDVLLQALDLACDVLG